MSRTLLTSLTMFALHLHVGLPLCLYVSISMYTKSVTCTYNIFLRMAVTQHRSLLELPFYDIDDTEVLTLNSELLHECDLNGTCLSYQPYRYADYNECDAMRQQPL